MIKCTFHLDTNESMVTYFDSIADATDFVRLLTPGTFRLTELA